MLQKLRNALVAQPQGSGTIIAGMEKGEVEASVPTLWPGGECARIATSAFHLRNGRVQ